MQYPPPAPDQDPTVRSTSRSSLPRYSARALAIWPGLDRDRLARTRGDPARITRLVTRRTSLSAESIFAVLTKDGGFER
jgi:hypothetical protein